MSTDTIIDAKVDPLHLNQVAVLSRTYALSVKHLSHCPVTNGN